jgi:hypothetical protein
MPPPEHIQKSVLLAEEVVLVLIHPPMELVLHKQQVLLFLLEHLTSMVLEALLVILGQIILLFLLKVLVVYWEHGAEAQHKIKQLQDLEDVEAIMQL